METHETRTHLFFMIFKVYSFIVQLLILILVRRRILHTLYGRLWILGVFSKYVTVTNNYKPEMHLIWFNDFLY